MFKELDVVKTLVEKNRYKIGSIGTIIILIPEKKGVVLEMHNNDGSQTLGWGDYEFNEIKLYWSVATGEYV